MHMTWSLIPFMERFDLRRHKTFVWHNGSTSMNKAVKWGQQRICSSEISSFLMETSYGGKTGAKHPSQTHLSLNKHLCYVQCGHKCILSTGESHIKAVWDIGMLHHKPRRYAFTPGWGAGFDLQSAQPKFPGIISAPYIIAALWVRAKAVFGKTTDLVLVYVAINCHRSTNSI